MAKKGRYGVSMIKTAFHPVMLMERFNGRIYEQMIRIW